MIKKQILEGRTIKEVEISLSEVEKSIKESLEGATEIKQVFIAPMDQRGMSMHSINSMIIEKVEISHFQDNLIIDVNKAGFAINDKCNILIQRPEPGIKFRMFFEDFNMGLLVI